MANLQEKPVWETGIYQLETSDPVLAGPDGVDNLQGRQLANRTAYLKQQLDGLQAGAPANLNTLQELAAALGNDAAFSVTVNNALARKADKATTLAGYGIADGASKTDLQTAVNALVAGAPGNLNTLQELAAALNNDAKYAATVDGKLAGKADKATTLAGYGIADAASASELAKVAAKVNGRRMVRVKACGYVAKNGMAGVEIDGVALGPVARSYNIVLLDASGNVSRSATFDVAGGGGQDKAAADWLNAVADGTTVIVYTFDEPQSNRLSGGLPQALYRCGASSAVFASDKFQYRSAYILIGRAGCGEGQGVERYRGDGPGSADAQLDVVFELVNGLPLLGGGQVSGAAAPSGQIAYFAMPNAPDGWLKANGAQVSQSTYGNLYAAIGQTFAPTDPAVLAMLRLDAGDAMLDRVWNKQLIAYGGADMSTEQSKFGGASLKTLIGGGYAALGLTDPFNPDAFTIEGWHYPTFAGSGGSNGYSATWVVSMNASAATGEISIAIDRASRAPLVWLANSGGFFANASPGTAGVFNSPRWYHVAFSYDGTTYRLFVDGAQVWSLANATRVLIPDNTLLFGVDGCAPGVAGSSAAYYQDWKVSKLCRYTANFALPTAPAAYQLAADAGKFFLPNLCGEFIRGWSDSRKDVEKRAFGSWQKGTLNLSDPSLDAVGVASLIHATNNVQDGYQDVGLDPVNKGWYQIGRAQSATLGSFDGNLDSSGWNYGYGSTRPRNVAMLACVKY
ncbi:LamG-like jellyroll fold domain-containing protein [Chromobacterium vaccinii]|uniref:LamG-like jellyroll fold domain-containing protein n=1 Tax=Chromobacterium vaccinii TaxID=1108595 RepID=UPI003C748BBE